MSKKNEKIKTYRGELALLLVVLINSFGVVLMLYSGSGISAVSSVPYAFSEVFPAISLGTWTYIFQTLPLRILYFISSYLVLAFGVALSNRCKMPIVPTDLFPRELSGITRIPYSRIKVPFDVTCLAVTALMTWIFLGEIRGLGIGTVIAAFTLGKAIGIIGDWMDRHMTFVSFLEPSADPVTDDSSQARTV